MDDINADLRRHLEVEEEFDLVKLGFVSGEVEVAVNNGKNHGRVGAGTGAQVDHDVADNVTSPMSISIDNINDPSSRQCIHSLRAFSHRAISGSYASADWTLQTPVRSDDAESAKRHKNVISAGQEPAVVVLDYVTVPDSKSDKTGSTEEMATEHKASLDETGTADALNKRGSITSTPSLASGVLTSTETTTATPILSPKVPRNFSARLATIRRPGRKSNRMGIVILRKRVKSPSDKLSDVELSPPTSVEPAEAVEPPPDSFLLRSMLDTHGRVSLDKLKLASKLHNTTGDLLPSLLRDFFPALSDRRQAVQLANEVRRNLELDDLPARMDRVSLQKTLAQMRERLYMEIASAMIIPDPPPALPPLSPGEEKISMSLTPSSFETLSRTLPIAFHQDRGSIRSALQSKEGMYGEEGDVVWVGGVGRMKRKVALKDGKIGIGYRGEEGQGHVHIFVDHSNILHGLLHHLYSSHLPLPPKHQRILSLPCMSLLLQRGRPTRSSHLVSSSPLHQDLDPLVRLGWEVSVMKRVEIYEDEVIDPGAAKLTPKAVPRSVAGTLGGGGGGTRRYKEQGVDEVLTLKMLQTINKVEVEKNSTIVLATGDARGGQFNKEGFLGAVREAVGRGWIVELWSFSAGLSRAWKETAKRDGWGGRFRIYLMDEWAGELVEVNEDAE